MKKYILIVIMALMAVPTFAQHDEQVTVEGKYRPKVNKVNKMKLAPETPQPSYEMPDTEVTPKEAKQKFALDLEKIAPTGYAAKNDKLVPQRRTSCWPASAPGSRPCSFTSITPC